MKGRNKYGFTLIEMIVVIAIIGILAAIIIPTILNYVKKANLRSANVNAKLIFNTMNNTITDLTERGQEANVANCTSVVDCANDDSDAIRHSVYLAMKNNGNSRGYAFWCAAEHQNEIKLVQWCEHQNPSAGDMIGQYPDPKSDPDDMPSGFTWGVKF